MAGDPLTALVMGGSRGLGRAIAESLRAMGCDVTATSRADVDTSDLGSVRGFVGKHPEVDILVLNTGGPPPREFADVSVDEWQKYHNQLFLSMCMILRGIHVRDGGYVFLVSSSVIVEPAENLIVSGAYRSALSSVLKVLSRKLASRQVSTVNIAPGPMDTERLRELVGDADGYAASRPMRRLGRPAEIGGLVRGIVENGVKYLSGTTILLDGAGSASG